MSKAQMKTESNQWNEFTTDYLVTAEKIEELNKIPSVFGRAQVLKSPNGSYLVVLGESHVKPDFIKKREVDLIDTIPLRIVEGVHADGDKTIKRMMTGLHRIYGGAQKSLFGFLKDSSIRYAGEGATEIDFTEDNVIPFANKDSKYIVHAEKHRKIPQNEKRSIIFLVTFFHVALIGVFIGAAYSITKFSALGLAHSVFSILSILFNQYFVFDLLTRFLLKRPVTPFGLSHLLDARNEVMAEQAAKAMETQTSKLGVSIMGAAHTPGFIKIMKTKYGFTEVK